MEAQHSLPDYDKTANPDRKSGDNSEKFIPIQPVLPEKDGNFSKRDWLTRYIYDWAIDKDKTKNVFWLSGGPGIGKTEIITEFVREHQILKPDLCLDYEKKKFLILWHFFKDYDEESRKPKNAIQNLTLNLYHESDLIKKNPKFKYNETDFSEEEHGITLSALALFNEYIYKPIIDYNINLIIVLDAIDEISNDEESKTFINELVKKIQESDKNLIQLLITSRTHPRNYDEIKEIFPFSLHSTDPRCIDDARRYLKFRLKKSLFGQKIRDEDLRKLWHSSQGNFLYLDLFCFLMEIKGKKSLIDADYPLGLWNMYIEVFSFLFAIDSTGSFEYYNTSVKPCLAILCEARHPINYKEFVKIVNENYPKCEITKLYTEKLAHLFPVSKINGEEVIRPIHHSIIEWLKQKTAP